MSKQNTLLSKKENIKNEEFREYQKGINNNTISLIEEKMKKLKEYVTIETISEITGLSTQTINKYMNYLIKIGMIDLKIVYGKVGRPRNEYLWLKK